jgi:antitoxin HicB
MILFPITLSPDDNGTFLATCEALPEVTSFGEDEADAMSHAADAVAEAVSARLARFDPIPRPAPTFGPQVGIGTQLTMKVMLKWAMEDQGINRANLAKSIGIHRQQVDRLFDPGHATRLDQYDAAFRALGKAVSVELADAA